MFQEQRRYYQILVDASRDGNDRDEGELDTGRNEFGYVYRILVELKPFAWNCGAAVQVRVIKLVETEEGEHRAYCYYQRWFYDEKGEESFDAPIRTLMMALVKGEVIGKTAVDAVTNIFWATLKKQNYVAKFAPKCWAKWAKPRKAMEADFPKPSENPDDWGMPEVIRQPYDEITYG